MGSTNIDTPAPPAAPTNADAVRAYTESMPQMYANQMEWAPKIAAQDMALMEQYLPRATAISQQLQAQYAPQQAEQQWQIQQQYAPLLAQQQQQLQQQYEPGAYNSLQNLGAQMTPDYLSGQGAFNAASDPTLQKLTGMMTPGYLSGEGAYREASNPLLSQLSGMMTPDYLTGYSAQEAPGMQAARDRLRQSARSAWADRGLAESGMSAENETKMLSEFELPYAMQQEQMTQNVLNQRQSLAAQLGTTGLESQQNAINNYNSTLAQRQGLAAQLGTSNLQAQGDAWQNYYAELGRRQNVGLSLAGRYNTPTQQSVSSPQIGVANYQAPNLMSDYTYGNVLNAQTGNYGNYANTYGNMYATNQKQTYSGGLNLGILGTWGGGVRA